MQGQEDVVTTNIKQNILIDKTLGSSRLNFYREANIASLSLMAWYPSYSFGRGSFQTRWMFHNLQIKQSNEIRSGIIQV